MLTDCTSHTFAELTLHIDSHARTDLGVVFVAEAKDNLVAKEELVSFGEDILEVLDVDATVNNKALVLKEEATIGTIGSLVAVYLARYYHANQ